MMGRLKICLPVCAVLLVSSAWAERLTYVGTSGGSWHAAGAWQNEAGAQVDWTDGATAVLGDKNIVLGSDAVAEGLEWSTTAKRTITGAGRLTLGAGGLVNGGTGELNIGNVGGLHLTADQTWTTRTTAATPLTCLDGQRGVTTAEGVTVTVTGRTQLRWNAKAALPATTTFHIVAPAFISFSSGNAAFGSPTMILDGNGNRVSFGSVYDQKNCTEGVFASVVHLRNGADMQFNASATNLLGLPRFVVDGTQGSGDASAITGSADTRLSLAQTTFDVAQDCRLDLSLTFAEKDGVTAALVKTGAGTLRLNSSRAAFSGGVVVREGALDVSAATGAGTGPLSVAASGTLRLSCDGTLPNAVTGSGTLERSGSGVLALSGDASAFSGAVQISSGTLRAAPFGGSVLVSRGAAWAVLGNLSYGTAVAPLLDPATEGSVLAGAGSVLTVQTVSAGTAPAFDAEKGGLLQAGALSGAGWTKNAAGDVRVGSCSGYTGTTLAVASGVLLLASPSVIPDGCVVETSGAGIVQFDAVEGFSAAKIGGTKAVAFADGATAAVDTSSPDGVPSRLAVAEGNTFNVTALTGSGDFYKQGPGTLELAGAASFAGRIFVLDGVLRITGAAGSNDIVVSNGVCSASGAGTVLRNTFKVQGGRLQAEDGASLGSGTLSLAAGGEVCATNGGTFGWGDLTVSAGTVRIARGGVVGTTALTVGGDGTLAVADGTGIATSLTLSGGTLSFEDDTSLAAPVTQTSATSIRVADGRTATLTGPFVNNNGKCQPKGPGTLVFAGGVSCPSGGSEFFVQGGTAVVATNDFVTKAYFGVEQQGRRLVIADGAKVTASGSGKGLHVGTSAGVTCTFEVTGGAEVELQEGFHVQLGAWNNACGNILVSDGGVFRHLSTQSFSIAHYPGATSRVEVVDGVLETRRSITRGSGPVGELVLSNATVRAKTALAVAGSTVSGTIAGTNALDVAGWAVSLDGTWQGDGSLAVSGTGGSFALPASQAGWTGALDVSGADLVLGAGVDLANESVAVADGSISVASGQASLPLLAGASATKAGAGTLVVSQVDDPACELTVAGGGVRIAPGGKLKPAGVPAGWLDATVASSLSRSGDKVTKWSDRRGGGHPFSASSDASHQPPVYNADGFGGKPFLDFGIMADRDKGRTGDNRMMQFAKDQTNIRAVFWMVGSRNGGGFLLGDKNVSGSARCFHRSAGPGTTYGAVASDPLWHATADRGGWVKDGTTWLNGQAVDGTKTGLGGSWDLVSWRLSEADDAANRTPTATWLASCYADTGGRLNGGQDLAEIIIYTNRLTDAEVRATERYLADKWMPTNAANRVRIGRLVMRGEGTSFTVASGVPVSAAAVAVEAAGATVRGVADEGTANQVVLGDVSVASGADWNALNFAGTEVTNVAFEANAVVRADVDAAGRTETFVVQGSIALPATLLYSVSVPEKVAVRRTSVLKAAGDLAGTPSLSRAAGSGPGAAIAVDAAARALVLVSHAGSVLYLR